MTSPKPTIPKPTIPQPHRIDVHHHAILPEISRLIREQGAPFTIPWSLPDTERMMDTNGIEFAIISNAVPGDFFSDAARSAQFNRAVNVAVAEFVAEHPSRFGLISAVPMPYVDEALAEVAYSFDELHADGILLVPHAGESYLGDPLYDPLFEELDRRHATVLVHPMSLPGTSLPSVPYVLADFLLDTTRGALNLIMTGALDRYPNVSFILSHGGGFLPYAATRVELLANAFFAVDRELISRNLQRFYYDIALSAPSALPSLLATIAPERILFGTDWCAAPAEVVNSVVASYAGPWAGLSEADRPLIDRDNALRLFPRVAEILSGEILSAEVLSGEILSAGVPG